MEYVQERVATLHDFGGAMPDAPTDRAGVVVPITGREHASLTAERVLTRLGSVDPDGIYLALRADPDRVGTVVEWVDSLDVDPEILWCNAPALERQLADADIGTAGGKGRDVWLALGVATAHEYVAVHDADATSYSVADVPKLLYPLANGFDFAKGYYARIEDDQLYGRLFRLFVSPLLCALAEQSTDPLLSYLRSFRYALAGEFAATAALVRSLRVQPGWGLELGTLGDAFRHAGFDGSAQVDLGRHEHDHRGVGGPGGLEAMAREVGAALFRAITDRGIAVEYGPLADRYRTVADAMIDQYAADAGFNDLSYDAAAERSQVESYAGAIAPPGEDDRLPAWRDCALDPEAVRRVSREALADETGE